MQLSPAGAGTAASCVVECVSLALRTEDSASSEPCCSGAESHMSIGDRNQPSTHWMPRVGLLTLVQNRVCRGHPAPDDMVTRVSLTSHLRHWAKAVPSLLLPGCVPRVTLVLLPLLHTPLTPDTVKASIYGSEKRTLEPRPWIPLLPEDLRRGRLNNCSLFESMGFC